MNHLRGWEHERSDPPSLAERIAIILAAMGFACAVALFVWLGIR